MREMKVHNLLYLYDLHSVRPSVCLSGVIFTHSLAVTLLGLLVGLFEAVSQPKEH